MSLGLNLSLGGRGGASGGGSSLPASVTRYWAPADMTFNGSNELTAITDRVAGSSAYIGITGAPTGSTTTGLAYTEASGASNYVTMDNDVWQLNPGRNMSFLVRRNATPDDFVAILNNVASDSIFIVAQNGAATSNRQNFTFSGVRHLGTSSTPTTRDQLWDVCFNKTGWVVITLFDVVHVGAGVSTVVSPFRYSAGTLVTWEGDFAGFCEFTDDADADAVETALLAEVA